MIWDKIKRFLLIWAAIAVLLIIAAVVVHWSTLAAAISGNVGSAIGGIVTIGIMVLAMIWLLRTIFR